jgi:hypothetical protein
VDLIGDDDGGIHTVAEISVRRDGGVERLGVRPFNDPMCATKHAKPPR